MRAGTAARTFGVVMALSLSLPDRVVAAPADPAVAEARELFEEGDLKYRSANYSDAIDRFEQAHEKAAEIEDGERREHVMTTLLFNLARAHSKAYEVDQDASHLRRAKELLRSYLASEAARDDELDAEALQREVEATLSELEADDDEDDEDASTSGSATDEPGPGGLVIGGIVLSSLSAAGLGLMTGGLVMGNRAVEDYRDGPSRADRDDALESGERGNALAIAGGVVAGALLVAGLTLIIVGKKRRNEIALFPTPAGLALGGRF